MKYYVVHNIHHEHLFDNFFFCKDIQFYNYILDVVLTFSMIILINVIR